MIYLVEGYDLPVFFWKGFFLQKEALFDKISLGMVEGYDLSKTCRKIRPLQNYGGRI